jgi:heme exporter protein D
MIPDLGKYAVPVLASYGVSLLLIAGLVWASLRRSVRIKRALQETESRRKSNG